MKMTRSHYIALALSAVVLTAAVGVGIVMLGRAPAGNHPTALPSQGTTVPGTSGTAAPTTEPSAATTVPTTVATDPTAAPTEPTTVPTEPTTAPTEPTTVPTEPSQPEPTTEPTEPAPTWGEQGPGTGNSLGTDELPPMEFDPDGEPFDHSVPVYTPNDELAYPQDGHVHKMVLTSESPSDYYSEGSKHYECSICGWHYEEYFPPLTYDCGYPDHGCTDPEVHERYMRESANGCPMCGKADCASLHGRDIDGWIMVDLSLCPQYDIHRDPEYYCQNCGRPNSPVITNDPTKECRTFWHGTTCQYCKRYVAADTCHTCDPANFPGYDPSNYKQP